MLEYGFDDGVFTVVRLNESSGLVSGGDIRLAMDGSTVILGICMWSAVALSEL